MERFYQNTAVRTFLALVCCALWGSAFPCVKLGYKLFGVDTSSYSSLILFAGVRFTLAGVLVLIFGSITQRKILLPKRRNIWRVGVVALFQTAVQYTCFYIGLAYTTGAKGSVINGSNAFFSIIAAHFLLKDEKLTWKKIAGCLIGFAGVVVINLSPGGMGDGFRLAGEGLILVCACAYGISSVTLKMIEDRESPMTITAFQLLMGGAVLILIGLAAGGRIGRITPAGLALLLYMALLSTVSFILWAELLKYNPVGKVAIFGFSIPVFGVVLSAIFLEEQVFRFQNLMALLLVSLGIFLVNMVPSGKAADDAC